MQMYNKIVEVYDQIFPVKEETMAFLLSNLPKGSVLDLGCATGSYAIKLSQKGYRVYGLDYSQEMVDYAINQNKKLSQMAHFTKRDMLDLDEKNAFIGIYSIGNTLVHLPSKEDVWHMLKHIYEALKPGGTLVLQIINYDRILDQKVDSLPTIEFPNGSFMRKYEVKDELIAFTSVLTYQDITQENVTMLLPLRYEELKNGLKEAGFENIHAYDGFSNNPFKVGKSVQLVIKANKA